MAVRFVFNEHYLTSLLRDENGMVAKDLQRRALNVESQAKLNASGQPVAGAQNPEGRGPNVDTGRLRSSITHELARKDDGTLVARIGTNVSYGKPLETGLRGGRTYPFLVPALEAART